MVPPSKKKQSEFNTRLDHFFIAKRKYYFFIIPIGYYYINLYYTYTIVNIVNTIIFSREKKKNFIIQASAAVGYQPRIEYLYTTTTTRRTCVLLL